MMASMGNPKSEGPKSEGNPKSEIPRAAQPGGPAPGSAREAPYLGHLLPCRLPELLQD
jgi:hypothetical protein